MPHQFQMELAELKANLIRMASIVEEQVHKAVSALESMNSAIHKEMKVKDDEVDAYDELLQIQCENILALHQPIAYDLRFVLSTLMINNQLERCGDISVSIANRAKKVSGFRDLVAESGINEMAKETHKMISRAIDSFIHSNSELAKQVIANDQRVNDLNKLSFEFITQKMKSHPDMIEPLAHILIIARQIERLADHSTNIAENILFVTEAKIVSHRKTLETNSKVN